MPKLSIIVPVYNVERYLDTCVKSLLNQTLRDIEIILVDDESPDYSPQMCDGYARMDNRVKVIHKKNAGLGFARNSGLDVACGEYITFVDSDDYIDSFAYEKACSLMDEKSLDELRFDCNRFKNDGSFSSLHYAGVPLVFNSREEITRVALCIFDTVYKGDTKYDWGGSSCMAIYKSSIIEQHGLRFVSEREYMSEDYIFNLEYYLQCTRIGYLRSTFYHYRINPNSLTRTVDLKGIRKAELYSQHIENMIAKYGLPEDCKMYGMGYYVRALRSNMKKVFLSEMTIHEKRKWFFTQIKSQYCERVRLVYPVDNLPFKQKLCHKAIVRGCFVISYVMIVIFSKIRTNRFK